MLIFHVEDQYDAQVELQNILKRELAGQSAFVLKSYRRWDLGLAALQKERPDCVIVDMCLSGGGQTDWLKAMEDGGPALAVVEKARHDEVPVLVLSNLKWTDMSDKVQAQLAANGVTKEKWFRKADVGDKAWRFIEALKAVWVA